MSEALMRLPSEALGVIVDRLDEDAGLGSVAVGLGTLGIEAEASVRVQVLTLVNEIDGVLSKGAKAIVCSLKLIGAELTATLRSEPLAEVSLVLKECWLLMLRSLDPW